jgi:hypothetical protein
LDWTTNPLVAAYFAVIQSPKSAEASALIYSFRTSGDDYVGREEIDPFSVENLRFYLPRFVSPRIAAQSGLFSIHSQPNKAWESEDLETFTIPGEAKGHFQRRLHFLGVNAFKLFPSLDGLATTLNWQYQSGIELWHIS